MRTLTDSSINKVKEVVVAVRDAVTNTPPDAKTLLLLALPGAAAFPNGPL